MIDPPFEYPESRVCLERERSVHNIPYDGKKENEQSQIFRFGICKDHKRKNIHWQHSSGVFVYKRYMLCFDFFAFSEGGGLF